MVRSTTAPPKTPRPAPGIAARLVWQTVGTISLILGLVGVVLPIMPTAPFIILAAFAFARSAPAVQAWLERNALFGPMIADWKANGAIALKYKIFSITAMTMSLVFSLVIALPPIIVSVQAVCIAAAALFILSRPSRPS